MRVSYTAVRKDEEKEHWHITAETDTGRKVQVSIPMDTMEWRAAEYEIDPNDRATLLDIVLSEVWMTPEDVQQDSHLYGSHGVMAASQQEARDHHLARVARVKLRHRISTRGADHVLNQVRDESYMHPKALDLKRRLVQRNLQHAHGSMNRRAMAVEDKRISELAKLVDQYEKTRSSRGDHDGEARSSEAGTG